jgi:hypothetical protein
MLKQWMQASQAQLKSYEWVETTVIAKGGEEKSRKQATAYYGVDGKLQKVPLAGATAESGARGPVRKGVAARKKEQVADYMESAAALVHAYVPPDPNRIQQSAAAGKLSLTPLDGGRRVQLVFQDYLKAGDSLSVEVETATNRLLGMNVASYLDDSRADAIQMAVAMGVLPDGTIYTAKSTLAAPAKDLTVVVENTGHRRMTTP